MTKVRERTVSQMVISRTPVVIVEMVLDMWVKTAGIGLAIIKKGFIIVNASCPVEGQAN